MNLHPLLSLGIIFLFALLLSGILHRARLPTVTSYLLLGIIIGPLLLDMVSNEIIDAGGIISTFVLSIISFSLGRNFSRERFQEVGKEVFYVSLLQSVGAFLFTAGAVYIITGSGFKSFMLASLAAATAPAAVVMAVREMKARGRFTDTLLGVVAFSDVWGVIIFALIFAVMRGGGGVADGLLHGLYELTGAVILGIISGWFFSFFSRYIKHPSELLVYTLGFILLNCGLAVVTGLSVLFSSMAMSATLVNINRESFKFFKAVGEIDKPLYIMFFVLSGAGFEFEIVTSMGLVIGVYVLARIIGKIAGVSAGCRLLGCPRIHKKYLGLALAPQAGVALGMGMIIRDAFPQGGEAVLSIIIATTIVCEIFGPLLTQLSLVKSGEASA